MSRAILQGTLTCKKVPESISLCLFLFYYFSFHCSHIGVQKQRNGAMLSRTVVGVTQSTEKRSLDCEDDSVPLWLSKRRSLRTVLF